MDFGRLSFVIFIFSLIFNIMECVVLIVDADLIGIVFSQFTLP